MNLLSAMLQIANELCVLLEFEGFFGSDFEKLLPLSQKLNRAWLSRQEKGAKLKFPQLTKLKSQVIQSNLFRKKPRKLKPQIPI